MAQIHPVVDASNHLSRRDTVLADVDKERPMQSMCCRGMRWMGMALCLTLVAWVVGCRGSRTPALAAPDAEPITAVPKAPAVGSASSTGATAHVEGVSGHPLVGATVVGLPMIIENLTVFPILSGKQTDIGPITTLHSALAKNLAEVRELGNEEVAGPEPTQDDGAVGQRARPLRQHARLVGQSSGPRVGTLVIENKGDVPIYVLAGTVVKGGNQDRQIAQDFLVAAKTTVPIDAFCVEHGRWSKHRQGKATGGKFTATEQLATSEVRVAGQYERDQSKVWSKVGKVNQAHKKRSGSDSLMATLDAADVVEARDALARRVTGHLARVTPAGSVVGYAYAVDGKVKGVRWFANSRVFELFREVLVRTSALDAITARAGNAPQPPPPLAAESVKEFIEAVDASEQKREQPTPAENINEYSFSEEGYGSKTRLKAKPGRKAVEVSSDYASK